jgi:hypothetical protein
LPFFRFEVRTPTHVMASDGGEFANSDAARVEAARRIGDLLRKHAGEIWTDEDWQMDITDESGLILYVITVNVTQSPATAQTNRPTHSN